MAAIRPVWMERPTVPTSVIKAIVLVVITVIMLYPFVYVVSVSLSSPDAVRAGDVLLFPIDPTLEAYRIILNNGLVARALMVSVGVTLVGTLISVLLTVTLAYGLTRTRDVPGARVVLYLVLFTMLFSAGIIPNYLLVKSLGLLDTYAALIVPVAINAFNLVVIRNFFMNLPQELIDSAKVDGASEWQILWRIVLPLSKAAVAVIALFYGVAYWNDFFHAMIYLNDTEKWPVQLVLRQYVLGGSPFGDQAGNEQIQLVAKNLQMAVVALATIPILAVYPFLQRFFTTGVLTGAIKG